MIATSALYNTILANPAHHVEWKITINGTAYGKDKIVDNIGGDCRPKISRKLFSTSQPSVGECYSSRFSCTIFEASGSIPRMATVIPAFRLVLGSSVSEWIDAGKFYIDVRKTNKANGSLTLSCFDDILKLDGVEGKNYADVTGFDEWPQSMSAVANEIASIIGVTIDSRTVINSGANFMVDYPNDLTMREVMERIASAHCACWTMTNIAKLRLVPITGGSDTLSIMQALKSLQVSPALPAWSGVEVYWADEESYESGTDTGRVLVTECPWALQGTADSMLSAIRGTSYQPFTAAGAITNLALELGDIVTLGKSGDTVTGPVFTIDIVCDSLSPMDISAPGEAEVDHEYPYTEYVDRSLKRRVGLGQAYYGVTISRKNGLEIARTDGRSEALFNSDVFAMRALIDGTMQPRIYFDPIRGDYVFNGALGADAIFTDSLYAELGFVAELTVDRLTTSRRVRKYLLQDTSDDNYIQIQDHYQKFITGSVISADVLDTEAGQHLLAQNNLYMAVEPPNDSYLVVQVTNRYGQRLYWQREIVSVTADGYPLDENNRQIYATTEVTDWPVLSYAYAEQTKAEIAFEPDGQYYVPQIVLGAGDNHGNSRGYIYKRQTDLLMRYVTTNGKNVDIQFSDEGYVDALHRRLSYLHIMRDQVGTGGTIYYKVEGNDTMHTLEFVEIDGLLRYTWPDGHVCEVSVE